MTTDIKKPLQLALSRLEEERRRIEKQIAAIEQALTLDGGEDQRGPAPQGRARKRSRSRMGAAERRAVSRRMKEYWAKRRKRVVASKKKRAA